MLNDIRTNEQKHYNMNKLPRQQENKTPKFCVNVEKGQCRESFWLHPTRSPSAAT